MVAVEVPIPDDQSSIPTAPNIKGPKNIFIVFLTHLMIDEVDETKNRKRKEKEDNRLDEYI